MIAAFAYLTYTSTRNRLIQQFKRLRNPRYAVALLLGLGYFWMVFFNSSARDSRSAGPALAPSIGAILPIFVLAYIAYLWIVGTDKAALAFSEAEVSQLFTAPVSRRGLIVYKLVRAQMGVLTTSVLWMVLFHRSGESGPERIIASWAFLSTFSLHRLGVALIRASHTEHGSKGFRRTLLATMLFLAVAVVVGKGLYDGRAVFSMAADLDDMQHALAVVFGNPPLSWVLYPFRVAVAPMFATSSGEWMRVMPAALVLLALHFWWVLRSDSAFEEAAAEASTAQAKRIEALRTRGVSGVSINAKHARRTIALKPTGPPAVAIFWKNVLWLVRTGQVRGLVGLPLIAFTAVLAFAGRSEKAEVVIMVMCSTVSVMILVFGPLTMRNDLRGELRRLPMLKTLPLRGRDIIFAEVASSATPTAVMQFLLVAVTLLAMSFVAKTPLPVDVRLGVLFAAPLLLLGLNFANFTIHNGLALLFPGWVRLGEHGGSGVEAMGQMMLTSLITLFMLAVLLIVPALTGAVVWAALRLPLAASIVAVGIVAGIALTIEGYLLAAALGGSLDRLEPAQVG
ncbi:MAG: putative ABC exporter domain-containing protein [Gemmatimonadaceae bacterium]